MTPAQLVVLAVETVLALMVVLVCLGAGLAIGWRVLGTSGTPLRSHPRQREAITYRMLRSEDE